MLRVCAALPPTPQTLSSLQPQPNPNHTTSQMTRPSFSHSSIHSILSFTDRQSDFAVPPRPFSSSFCLVEESRGSRGHMGSNHSSLFWLSPSLWLCGSDVATLPARCLGNKHIFNRPGPASAKATLLELRLTTSGQKSWTAI